jgi:hypothetical protein
MHISWESVARRALEFCREVGWGQPAREAVAHAVAAV